VSNDRSRWGLMALAAVMPGMVLADAKLTEITVDKVGPVLEVVVKGDNLKKPKATLSADGRQLILEFQASSENLPSKVPVWKSGLKYLSTAPGEGKAGRNRTILKFEFSEPAQPQLEQCPTGWTVSFGTMDEATYSGAVQGIKPSNPFQTKTIRTSDGFEVQAEAVVGQIPPKQANIAPAYLVSANSTGTGLNAVVPQEFAGPKVSLDFVNTEVVQILKALALQTRVNIVTSPKVQGKLSVALDNVSVRQALNLITSMAGLKFGEVGKTYIVTTKEDFLETFKQVGGSTADEPSETRVVPIYSGEGNQIKATILKTVLQDAADRFEVVLPSDRVSVSQKQAVGGNANTGDDAKDDGTTLAVTSSENAKDTYVVLIGSQKRIDELEGLVKKLDRQICGALGIRIPTTTVPVSKTYVVKGGRAADLVQALAGQGKTMVGTVEMFATPAQSLSKQTIVLKGREDEVAQVMLSLEQLDAHDAALESEFKMVDLQFVDPRAVREVLVSSIPGISVTIPPASAGNPRLYMPEMTRMQAEQRGTDAPAPQGPGTGMQGGPNQMQGGMMGGQQGQGGMAQQLAPKTSKSDDQGIILPYSDFETVGVPMKLVLRGTPDQIKRAQDYLKVVDVAPKQVAVELRVMELSKEDFLRLGLDWNLLTGGAVKFLRLNNSQSNPSNTVGVGIEGRSLSGDVTASLDSIANKNNLIAKPNLLAMDGRESELFIGDAIRYIESIINGQNGPSVTTGTVRVGVRLSLFPRVGTDSVTMDMRPSVSFLRGFENVPQLGGRLPQTSERMAQQTVTIGSGETIAISGLITQQDRRTLSGVPILKDLPLLGQLFRRTDVERIRTELVIFVTTKIIDGPVRTGQKVLPLESDMQNDKDPKAKKPNNDKKSEGGAK